MENKNKTLDEALKEVEAQIDWDDYKEELESVVVVAKIGAVTIKAMIDELERLGVPKEVWAAALQGKKGE